MKRGIVQGIALGAPLLLIACASEEDERGPSTSARPAALPLAVVSTAAPFP